MSVRSIPRHSRWLLALALLAAVIGLPAPVAAVGSIPVTAASPNSGSVAGGTTVTITGSGFTAGAKVSFGGAAATAVVVVSGTRIVCRTLAHAAGVVTVTVTVPGPRVGNLVNGYTYTSVLARLSPVAQEFPTPTANSSPNGIAAGPDGNLWFTEFDGNKIGRVTPTGTITEFPTPTANSGPVGIAAGPDGNMWFTEHYGHQIGRITPSGAVTEFSAGITAGSGLQDITAGPDDNLWFTEFDGNKIGRVTPTGAIIEFSAGITAGSDPDGITAGPDDNLWFTDNTGNSIGVLVVAPPTITALSPISGPANAPTTVTITGSGFAPDATVSFGGVRAPILINNPTSITATAPAHGPGTVDVAVTSGGATATVHGFTYGTPAPAPLTRSPGSSGGHPDPLPPSRGGPTGGIPNPVPPSRPLFP